MDDVYLKLGITFYQDQKYQEALEYLNKVLELNEHNGNAYYYIGNCYYYQDKLNEAFSFFEKAIMSGGKLEESHRKMGLINKKNGDNDKAESSFVKVLEINPKNHYAYYMLGKIFYEKRNFQEAIIHYQKAILYDNNNSLQESKEGLILSYASLNQRTKAFELLKQFFLNKMSETAILAFKARLHKEFNEFIAAIDSINLALLVKPNDPFLRGDKVVYLYYLNNFEECITEGEKIIAERKSIPFGLKGFYSLLFYVGCSYLRCQDLVNTKKCFDEYESLVRPGMRKGEYYIEKARIHLDQSPQTSLEYIEKALEINPDSVEALKFKLYYYEQNDDQYKNEIKELKERIKLLDVKKEEQYDVMYDGISESFLVQSNMLTPELNTQEAKIQSKYLQYSNTTTNTDIENKQIEEVNSTITQSSKNLDIDLKEIGRGGFGNVYLTKMYTGEIVALKRFNNDIKLNLKEREILESINHPNIVKYLGFFKNDIQMELCHGGDLYALVITRKADLPLKFKFKIMLQIAEALSYLHNEKGIIHGDIKNKNILLDKEYNLSQKTVNNYPNVKLCDFGLSLIANDNNNYKRGGSLAYASPELLNGGDLTFQSDIYSFAMTMFELFTGKIPYSDFYKDYGKEGVENSIKRGITPNFDLLENFPKELIQLFKDCCKTKPNERSSINDILKISQLLNQL